ncbi:MAG: GNAT family N-acetyltransferase [Gloeomargarita sp. DG02_3_bins_56]
MDVEILIANLGVPHQARALVGLLAMYALDPMGGGQGLSEFTKTNLVQELSKRPYAHVILAFWGGEAVGVVVAFEGFSTFACRPLLNIHDIFVHPNYRGQGISKRLLAKAEQIAVELGCCKLTLEVLEGNFIARAAYQSFGFKGYELDPKMGKALFLEKKL